MAPCWWDDRTRLYGPAVTSDERRQWGLDPLWDIVASAARIAGLALFSTEIALVADGRFIVVDYVNDPVDLRFLPHAREGMPADVARAAGGGHHGLPARVGAVRLSWWLSEANRPCWPVGSGRPYSERRYSTIHCEVATSASRWVRS